MIKSIKHNSVKLIVLFLLALSYFVNTHHVNGQIPLGVTVNIFPPYPSKYNIWISNSANYIVTIVNNSDTEFDYYLRASVEGVNANTGTFIRISESFFPPTFKTISPFQVDVISSEDLEELYGSASINDLDRSPNIPLDLDGELPEGDYQLCFEVMLYDPMREVFLSPKMCSDIFTVSHANIQLNYPLDETVWDQTDIPIPFQWSNISSHMPTRDYEYVLKLYELDPLMVGQESIFEYIQSGAAPFYITEPLMDFSYIYDVDFGLPEFIPGNLYAAQVEVMDMEGSGWFDNQNLSNINTFWFGYNPFTGDGYIEDTPDLDCFQRCEVNLPSNTVPISDYSGVNSFKMGHFNVERVQSDGFVTGTTLSGTGYVTLNFLNDVKLAVQFSGVTMNNQFEALSGQITGITKVTAANIVDELGAALSSYVPLDNNLLGTLSEICNDINTISNIANGKEVSLPFGLGQEVGEQAFTLAITKFEANVNGGQMDIVNILDLTQLGPNFRMGLGASDVCVAPDGFGNQFKIHLLEDANLPLDGDLTLTFKGGNIIPDASYDIKNNQSPCYVEMACEGVKAVCISGTANFPEALLKKEVNGEVVEGEKVRAYFSSIYERDFSETNLMGDILPKTDFILDFIMDDFQLAKLPGYSLKLKEGSIDLSETRNPSGIVFPEGYEKDFVEDNLWQGFYLRTLEIMPPKNYTAGKERSKATIHHVLIDPALTMDVEAYHMLPFERGVFKGWGLGIDTFELKILQNTLQHGKLVGKFGAPVFQEDAYLGFNALIDESNEGEESHYTFNARVEPSEDLQIPLAIAHATVCQNSYLAARFSKEEEEEQVEVFLKGDLDINTGSIGQAISGNAHIRLADYQLHYNTVDGFIIRDEVSDGRGSYFGANDNEEADCTELDYTTLQDAFDYMMARMIESGENVFRTIADETEDDWVSSSGGVWRDGDEMNGLPIRFRKSSLQANEGRPTLSLILEAQLTPESIIEAGIIISSRIETDGNRFHFEVDNIDLYISEGMIVLNQPVNESSMATNEPLQVSWSSNFSDEDLKSRLLYDVLVLPLDSVEQIGIMDSVFRNTTTFLYRQDETTGEELVIDLEDISDLFTTGSTYAIRIKGNDPEEETLNNDGYSNIHYFTWGQTAIVGTNAGANSECAHRCSPELPENTSPHPSPTSVESFTMGNFTIEVDGPVQQSGQLISGNGIVTIDFLNDVRLDVSFVDVGLNADGQALQGAVNGKKSNPDLLSQVTSYLAGGSNATSLQLLSNFLDEGRMIASVMTSGKIDLPFGLNVNMQSGDGPGSTIQMGFTDFNLTPTTSDVDFIYLMSLPNIGDGFNFGLGAQDLCIGPDGFGNEARLYLTQNLSIPLDGDSEIVFNGGIQPITSGTDTIQPFYLEIDCNGFKALNISGSTVFPQNMIVKENIENGQVIEGESVKGFFSMLLETVGGNAYSASPDIAGTNLLLQFSMDPFQIKGLPGWGFELTNGILDLSESDNAAGMVFPAGYDYGDLPDPGMWTGFYLKQLKFKPPAKYTDDGDMTSRPYFNIENLLIDPEFSAVFTAQDLLSFENGNIKGWGISIDSFGLSILQNSLISGGMRGEIGSPVLAESNKLVYQAVIDKKPSSVGSSDSLMMFTAIVRPQDDIQLPMLVADAELCSGSYLGLQLGQGDDNTHLELFLKGNVSIDLGNAADLIPGDFKIGAADLQLKYNTVKGFVMESEINNGTGTAIGLGLATGSTCTNELFLPDFDQLQDEFDSQGGDQTERDVAGIELEGSDGSSNESSGSDQPTDCSMNGFPIRLSGFDIGISGGMPEFSFVVDLALASGGQGFAAGAGLTIKTKRTDSGGKFNIGIDKVEFDCARLAVDLDFLELLACLCHESEDNDDGSTKNGYFGRVVVKALNNLYVDLQGGFATYRLNSALDFGTQDYHGYWYIDGTFSTNSGIPMGPVLLNSFGGGIYWNMQSPPLPGHDELTEATPDTGAAGEVNACIADLAERYSIEIPNGGGALGASPYHQASTTYGKRSIKLNAGLSFADPKLVILEPLVKVDWTANQGIDEITVGGYLYMLQENYNSRGAPVQPPTSMPGEPDLEIGANLASGGSGSKMWIASFNSLYFDRESADNTLVAFRGTGNFYVNILPNILYGSASSNDPYRMISHDIYIGHVDHQMSVTNGYQTGGDGQTYWHAYFGNPYRPEMGPGSISFDLAGAVGGGNSSPPAGGQAGITATMYAMMGHGLPRELPPIPDMILNIIDGPTEAEEGNSFDGDEVDANASREDLPNTTSGFAFGSTVQLKVGFEKIIYASLEVVLGMDLLFQSTVGTQCEANGNLYNPPGVGGFYGMGQAYAGLQGAVGVRGKVLGQEIDIKILELSAAMMVQAGGPNPFWIDGRAAISYNVLNGMIKGNARIEVSAGDRCYPYAVDGFTLDVIDAIYPDNSYTGDNAADPYTNPRVTFKMPVAHRDAPWTAQLQIPVVNGKKNEVKTIAPVLESLSLQRVRGGSRTTVSGQTEFSATRRSARYVIDSPLSDSDDPEANNWNLEFRVRIKTKESINGHWVYLDDFETDSLMAFQTSPLPPYIDRVTHTNPIRGQRYYMPQEWQSILNILDDTPLNNPRRGLIRFQKNEKDARFYAEDKRGYLCHYDITIKRVSDHEEVYRHTLTPDEIENRQIRFRVPQDLANSTRYYLQLVRRKTHPSGIPVFGGKGFINIQQIGKNIATQYDVEAEYSIEYETDDENAFENVNDNETLLHLVVFRTSQYNTLSEKLASVNVLYEAKDDNPSLVNDAIRLAGMSEPFEEIEMIGFTTVISNPEGGPNDNYFTHPRVYIMDPFKGNFFDNHVKPKTNALLTNIRDNIDGKFVGLIMNPPPDIPPIDLGPGVQQGSGMPFPPDGWSPLGPQPDTYHNYYTPVNSTHFLIDFNLNMWYRNGHLYDNGHSNVYGEYTIRQNSFLISQSNLQQPIPQNSNVWDMLQSGFVFGSDGNVGFNNGVMLTYRVRERVGYDIGGLVNWTEEKIDFIRDPAPGGVMQSWLEDQVNSHLQSTINAYNTLVTSDLYSGSASPISTNGQQLFLMSHGGPFRPSKLDFYYNTDHANRTSAQMRWIGSKVTKDVNN